MISSLVIIAGLLLVSCSSATEEETTPSTPTIVPTPWPTLSPLRTLAPEEFEDSEFVASASSAGPELLEQFRVELQNGVTSVYPLQGALEHPARIEVVILNGNPDPFIEIRNISGDLLVSADNAGSSQPEVIGQFQFPGEGYYELAIGSTSGSGSVGVSIYQLPPLEIEAGGTFTSTAQELRGVVSHPATYHTFRLPLERGQRIDIAGVALTEGLDLLFRLYGPDGVLLAARDDNIDKDPYLWNFLAAQSGIHTIVLSNYDESTGDYALRVTPSEGNGVATIGSRTPLILESSPRKSSWLVFNGRVFDGVRVEARPVDPGIDIGITIYDQFGNRLTSVNQFGADQPEQLTEVHFPYTGEYQVEFDTFGEGGEIEYFLRIVNQTDTENGGQIIAGGAGQEGEFVGAGRVFVWFFEAETGDLVGIDVHATGGTGLDLGFDLFSPDGYIVVTRDDVVGFDPVIDALEVPTTGVYALAVWNNRGTTGDYEVFVTRPDAPASLPD